MRFLMRTSRNHRSPRLRTTVAVLASLLAGCGDVGNLTEPRPPGGLDDSVLPGVPGLAGSIAFVSTRDGSPWIYVADSTSVRRLVPGDEPAWSPDGSMIAFESSAGIALVGSDGTNERVIRAGGYQPVWSPDGRRIAFRDGGIRVMQSDGSGELLLVADDFAQAGDELRRPDWSPDGQRIAFVRYDCCWSWPLEIYAAGLDGTPPRLVINVVDEAGNTVHYSHWSPAWSPDGRSMAFVHLFRLATIGATGGDLKFLGMNAAWESKLDWSPDGRHLVFSDYNRTRSGQGTIPIGQLRVYVADLSTSGVTQLIPDATAPVNPDYWDSHAVWSHARR